METGRLSTQRQSNSWSRCLTLISKSHLPCFGRAEDGVDGFSSGTIGLEEFVGLWKYLDQWRGLFKRFDADGSGAIDRNEFANALSAFGYRLSDNFVTLLFASYDKNGEHPSHQQDALLSVLQVMVADELR